MRIVLAGMALLGLATAADAADLPARMQPAPPVAAPVFAWTGFYVGAHGGYAWSDTDGKVGANCCVIFPLDLANGVFPRTFAVGREGAVGGGQIGFNYQAGGLVAGVEADVSWIGARLRATYSAPDPMLPGSPVTISSFNSKLDWLGTLRGRAGVSFERVLIYGTGGLAFGEVETRITAAIPAFGYAPPAWIGRNTQWGWTIGGGAEYALTQNISLKAEYLYYDLGKQTIRGSDPTTFPASEYIDYAFSTTGSIARAGVNFRF